MAAATLSIAKDDRVPVPAWSSNIEGGKGGACATIGLDVFGITSLGPAVPDNVGSTLVVLSASPPACVTATADWLKDRPCTGGACQDSSGFSATLLSAPFAL